MSYHGFDISCNSHSDSVMPTCTQTYPIQPVSIEMMSDLEEVLANEPCSSLTEPETVANVLDSSSVELKPVSTAPKSVFNLSQSQCCLFHNCIMILCLMKLY